MQTFKPFLKNNLFTVAHLHRRTRQQPGFGGGVEEIRSVLVWKLFSNDNIIISKALKAEVASTAQLGKMLLVSSVTDSIQQLNLQLRHETLNYTTLKKSYFV